MKRGFFCYSAELLALNYPNIKCYQTIYIYHNYSSIEHQFFSAYDEMVKSRCINVIDCRIKG